MAATDDDVDRNLRHIQRKSTELLDGIDNQQNTGLTAQLGNAFEIAKIAVAPLDRTDDYGLGATVNDFFETGKWELPIFVFGNTNLRTNPAVRLTPCEWYCYKFKVSSNDIIGGFQRESAGSDAQTVGCAFDNCNLIFRRADQPSCFRTRLFASSIDREMMINHRAHRGEHCLVEELTYGAHRTTRRNTYSGAVKKCLVPQSGKFFSNVRQ